MHRTNVITNTGFDPNEARDKAGKWTRIAVEESAAFKKWFGSSKVVDKDGKPLVVYHGSSRGKIPDIVKAPYFYTTDSLDEARSYKGEPVSPRTGKRFADYDAPPDSEIGVYYVRIENPKILSWHDKYFLSDLSKDHPRHTDIARWKAEGYDGVIMPWEGDDGLSGPKNYIPFTSQQVKHVANKGTFDPADPVTTHAKKKKKAATAPRVSPLRSDPTQTITMRREFAADLTRRLRTMQETLTQALDYSVSWPHKTPRERITAVSGWIDELAAKHLDRDDPRTHEYWAGKYVRQTFDKGARRAYDSINFIAGKEPGYKAGYKAQFITSLKRRYSQSTDLQIDAAKNTVQGITGNIKTWLLDELSVAARKKGTGATKAAIREVFDGIIKAAAKRDTSDLIVGAHAEAMLDAYEDLGVEQVGVRAEWITAGDQKVCPRCLDHEGDRMTIDGARGLIPLHPHCRCSWIAIKSSPPRRSRIGRS